MKKESNKSKMRAIVDDNLADELFKMDNNHIIFDSDMRKTFIEGVLQDVKGIFESKTDGAVEVMYEDFNLKSHEFGFKLKMSRGSRCSKQMFSEASSALVNVINYMFSDDDEQYDVTLSSSSKSIEVEIVSNW